LSYGAKFTIEFHDDIEAARFAKEHNVEYHGELVGLEGIHVFVVRRPFPLQLLPSFPFIFSFLVFLEGGYGSIS